MGEGDLDLGCPMETSRGANQLSNKALGQIYLLPYQYVLLFLLI